MKAVDEPLLAHVALQSSAEQKNFYDLLHFSPLKVCKGSNFIIFQFSSIILLCCLMLFFNLSSLCLVLYFIDSCKFLIG